MADSRYVYAIVAHGTRLPAELSGFTGERLQLTEWKDLAAVTGLIEEAAVSTDTSIVLGHEAVVEAIRECVPALPVRFGTIFTDASALERALERRYTVLKSDFNRLGDKLEFGLNALWSDRDEIEEATQQAAVQTRQTEGLGPGSAYLWTRVEEIRRQDARRARARGAALELNSVLAPLALEYRQVLAPSPRLALRMAYLLEPGGEEAFKQAFERIRRDMRDLKLLLSGPWPPYTFVSREQPESELSLLADTAEQD